MLYKAEQRARTGRGEERRRADGGHLNRCSCLCAWPLRSRCLLAACTAPDDGLKTALRHRLKQCAKCSYHGILPQECRLNIFEIACGQCRFAHRLALI